MKLIDINSSLYTRRLVKELRRHGSFYDAEGRRWGRPRLIDGHIFAVRLSGGATAARQVTGPFFNVADGDEIVASRVS